MKGHDPHHSDNSNVSCHRCIERLRRSGSFDTFDRVVLEWTSEATPRAVVSPKRLSLSGDVAEVVAVGLARVVAVSLVVVLARVEGVAVVDAVGLMIAAVDGWRV